MKTALDRWEDDIGRTYGINGRAWVREYFQALREGAVWYRDVVEVEGPRARLRWHEVHRTSGRLGKAVGLKVKRVLGIEKWVAPEHATDLEWVRMAQIK